MRAGLASLNGDRLRFSAIVERFGVKKGFREGHEEKTILLKDLAIANTGKVLTDHIWFTGGKWSGPLTPGDRVEFDARVDTYWKGYEKDCLDYRIKRPSNVVVVSRQTSKPVEAKEYPASLFKSGDRVRLLRENHTHSMQIGEVVKSLHSLWVEVVFEDGYRSTLDDRSLEFA